MVVVPPEAMGNVITDGDNHFTETEGLPINRHKCLR